jgi:hypothetical protein
MNDTTTSRICTSVHPLLTVGPTVSVQVTGKRADFSEAPRDKCALNVVYIDLLFIFQLVRFP